MTKRRQLLAALGGALAVPLGGAFGQSKPAHARVGILSTANSALPSRKRSWRKRTG